MAVAETVQVNPVLLDWAVERSGIDPDEISRRFPKLSKWRSEEAEPTRRQLESFAKTTLTPLGYFFLSQPPDEKLPLPDFRTKPEARRRRPSPNLLDTIYAVQARQVWLSEYLKNSGNSRVHFALERSNVRPEHAAATLRERLRLVGGWASRVSSWTGALDLLRDAAQEVGVFTVINGVVGNNTRRPLDPDEFRGFVLPDDYAPMVFLNGADAKSAQIFTLAHELAHLLVGEPGLFDLPRFRADSNSQTEVFCNAVAAEFLVPRIELQQHWIDARSSADPFGHLARLFKVSPAVIALRAATLRLINISRFDELIDRVVRKERRSSGGGNFYNNQNLRVGKRFARIVMTAARSGRLLYRDAYRLTGLSGETFDRYAKRLGVGV